VIVPAAGRVVGVGAGRGVGVRVRVIVAMVVTVIMGVLGTRRVTGFDARCVAMFVCVAVFVTVAPGMAAPAVRVRRGGRAGVRRSLIPCVFVAAARAAMRSGVMFALFDRR